MEAVDLRALAAVTAETTVAHILSRLAERPAGTERGSDLHTRTLSLHTCTPTVADGTQHSMYRRSSVGPMTRPKRNTQAQNSGVDSEFEMQIFKGNSLV